MDGALTPKGYMRRAVDARIDHMLRSFGAVCIEGPKACGKTWAALSHSGSVFFVSDPANDFSNRRLADASPGYILEGAEPRLIDEWQEIPRIWDAVRFVVDETDRSGRFLLTGSSTPQYKGVLHSGTGRIGRLRMRPMSLFESGDSTGAVTLDSLFNGTMAPSKAINLSIEDAVNLVVRGGWPNALNHTVDESITQNRGYIDSVLRDDLPRIDTSRRNQSKFGMVIKALARNEGTLVSNQKLMSDIREFDDGTVSADSLARYLDILERMYLIEPQTAFGVSLRSSARVGKSPRRRLADPSLAVAAMGYTPEMLIRDLRTFGFLFESLCVRDLRIYADTIGGQVFHYRDDRGTEVDAVIQLPDGRWGAFEVKLGQNQVDDAAENLLDFGRMISSVASKNPPDVLCVVTGMGSDAYRRPDGVYVVPISAMGYRP